MANKGKRETKKQITEVKQELQKELDKMGRVHSNIPTQQVEESGAIRRKSTVPPTPNTSLTSSKIPSNIVDNDNRKSSTTSNQNYNQPTQTKSKSKSSTSIKVPSVKEDDEENKHKGRPKGAKDKQPRKKRDFIKEAQDKLEVRREELNNIPVTTEEIKDKIETQEQEAIDRFQSDKEYAQAFYIGEIIESQILEMCAIARTYSFTVPSRIYGVEDMLMRSKEKYGEQTFYNNLWNKQGEILENCQTIVYSSKNQDVSRQERRVATLLLDIPYNEIEVDD